MDYQNVFKRYEIKYLLTKEQCQWIKEKMKDHMIGDKYGRNTICNIYYDTPNYLLIRRSIEGPVYKEKLRVRSYGVANENSEIFVELKKKFKKVVYKRRISMDLQQAKNYLHKGIKDQDSQIIHEIDYFMKEYNRPEPKVFISYEREAFYDKNDHDFRVTFDTNILWRDYDLSLCKGIYGQSILENNQVLMEIKTGTAIPLWMTALLDEKRIYKTSFSKYGNAYKTITLNQHTGGKLYA